MQGPRSAQAEVSSGPGVGTSLRVVCFRRCSPWVTSFSIIWDLVTTAES
jgi:hypothetical protein